MSIIMFVIFAFTFGFQNVAYANNINTSTNQNKQNVSVQIPEASIIGNSDINIKQSRMPNLIFTNFVCDEWNNVHFTFENYFDTIDRIVVTVKTPSVTSTKTFYNVPGWTSTHSMSVPMKKYTEKLTVSYQCYDGKSEFGLGTQTGTRTVPSHLASSLWAKGTFSSAGACLEYHFGKHGAELGINSILTYSQSAKNFRNSLPESSYI